MTHAWWVKVVSPYYSLYKAENQQISHIIFIASAINSVYFKTWNHTTSFYDSNLLPEASYGLQVLYVCVRQSSVFPDDNLLKLQSPNLDQKCKTPWLRSLLFLGFIDLDLQGQIELKKSKFTPLWACKFVRAISQYQMKWGFQNLDQKCILVLFRSLMILGLIDNDLHFNFLLQTCYVLPYFVFLIICFAMYIFS